MLVIALPLAVKALCSLDGSRFRRTCQMSTSGVKRIKFKNVTNRTSEQGLLRAIPKLSRSLKMRERRNNLVVGGEERISSNHDLTFNDWAPLKKVAERTPNPRRPRAVPLVRSLPLMARSKLSSKLRNICKKLLLHQAVNRQLHVRIVVVSPSRVSRILACPPNLLDLHCLHTLLEFADP